MRKSMGRCFKKRTLIESQRTVVVLGDLLELPRRFIEREALMNRQRLKNHMNPYRYRARRLIDRKIQFRLVRHHERHVP